MRRLIVSPWDLAATDEVLALQKEQGFPMMSRQEEFDYFEEFRPKDWFLLRGNKRVEGFIRHFPHFSTESWLQLIFRAEVGVDDLAFLWRQFHEAAFMEEADGFVLALQNAEPLSEILKREGFVESRERSWYAYAPSSFRYSAGDWKEPQGFQWAMTFAEEQDFLENQKLSPFQSNARIWWNEETDSRLRFEIRGDEILILDIKNASTDEAVDGISALVKKTGAKGVWSYQKITDGFAKIFKEKLFLK